MKVKENTKVYRHKRLDTNEIFYVGIGKRFRPYDTNGRSDWWRKIVSKAGYKTEILATNLSWELACELEMLLISEYGRKDLRLGLLVNMTDGGDGCINMKHSKETIEKIRIGNTGKKRNAEYRLKISKALLGRKVSRETRKKLSQKGYTRIVTNKTKEKLRKVHLGKSKTKESILKIKLTKIDLPKNNKNTSSKYKGVSYVKSRNKWRASIQIDNKTKNLGNYNTEEEAYKYYQLAVDNRKKELLNIQLSMSTK